MATLLQASFFIRWRIVLRGTFFPLRGLLWPSSSIVVTTLQGSVVPVEHGTMSIRFCLASCCGTCHVAAGKTVHAQVHAVANRRSDPQSLIPSTWLQCSFSTGSSRVSPMLAHYTPAALQFLQDWLPKTQVASPQVQGDYSVPSRDGSPMLGVATSLGGA